VQTVGLDEVSHSIRCEMEEALQLYGLHVTSSQEIDVSVVSGRSVVPATVGAEVEVRVSLFPAAEALV
jgi:hypothetical protein